jgi:hypothetical protein
MVKYTKVKIQGKQITTWARMVWMCSLILAILHGSGRSAAAAVRGQRRKKKNYRQMLGSRGGKKRGEEEEGK